jgi:hypothetical protein
MLLHWLNNPLGAGHDLEIHVDLTILLKLSLPLGINNCLRKEM